MTRVKTNKYFQQGIIIIRKDAVSVKHMKCTVHVCNTDSMSAQRFDKKAQNMR